MPLPAPGQPDASTETGLLFDRHPIPSWVVDPGSLRFLAVNEASVRAYGYTREEFLAGRLTDLLCQGDEARLRHALETVAGHAECRHRHRDGAELTVDVTIERIEWNGRPACLIAARDVGRWKDAVREAGVVQQRLEAAARMEAVGKLAGGIAHDFNNLLTGIRGNLQLLIDDLDAGDPRSVDLAEIDQLAARAAALTQQLLAFSRRQVLKAEVLDLNAVVGDAGRLFARLLHADVELATKLAPDLGRVSVDRAQLEQVLLNLIVNARDALPDGGHIVIETRNAHLSEADADAYVYTVVPGDYVVLSVSDDGVGMDPQTARHVFEPFYTTKEKGSGLGLATVYGIVKQSGGYIWVVSRPGQGTTFTVFLPRVEAPLTVAPDTASRRRVTGGREAVLVAEDEPAVRALMVRSLSRRGYSVVAAEDGRAALELLRGGTLDRLDLLVTDVVMPGMGGRQLARAAVEQYPDLAVLYTSGYTRDEFLRGDMEPWAGFLEKPFTPDALTRAVRTLLEARAER